MTTIAKGYKSYTIVDRLERELLILFQEHLSVPVFNLDCLALGMLLTISKKYYVNHLLFRDFSVTPKKLWHTFERVDDSGKKITEKIHIQAVTYVEEVLARRLTLAQNLYDRPSNMHLLLASLCHYGPDERWQHAAINRDRSQRPDSEDEDFFHTVARELAGKCTQLGDQYGEVSKNRRREYGPIWLRVDSCTAEVPEELSLADVLEILPKPLAGAFAQDPELQRVFARVLDSLNERYMLLRSCGLNPQEWLARPAPSINELKGLKKWRKHAHALFEAGQVSDLHDAFGVAFPKLRGERERFAGYSDFAEFELSEVGRTMLRYTEISLDDSRIDVNGDKERPWHETLPNTANVEEAVDFECKMQTLLKAKPERLGDSVMRYCLLEVIGRERSWYGTEGVLQDADFQQLIKAAPRYARLSEGDLVNVLSQQLEQLIKRMLNNLEGCDLRLMVASDGNSEDEIIRQFQREFDTKKAQDAVLIVHATSHLEKWTVAGFDDKGEFCTVVIDDPNHKLSKELKKEPRNKRRIVELATSSLGRTDLESGDTR